jgi:fucose 4-O-acetylase-like acetyltransferase
MSSGSLAPATAARIPWVDVAKGIGIILVFYGHFVQRFVELNVPAAADQMRWIYSFHMPLFFFLVGVVYKERRLSFPAFLKRQLRTRLVPAWAFSVVGMLVWVVSEYLQGESGWVHEYGWAATARYCATRTFYVFVQGRPYWNVLTWFLFCLFVVEVWQFCLRRAVRSNRRLAVSILSFGALATIVDFYSETIDLIPFWGAILGPSGNSWQIVSGLAAMFFYQLGILVRRVELADRTGSGTRLYVLGGICLAVTLLTYNLNHPLKNYPTPVVLMVSARYGNMWCFFITSLAGTFFVLCVSRMLSTSRLLSYIGQITLTLMCLDGLLLDFVNPSVVDWVIEFFPRPNAFLLTGICVLGTALSIAVCIPLTWFIERYLPFILGRGFGRATPLAESRGHPSRLA